MTLGWNLGMDICPRVRPRAKKKTLNFLGVTFRVKGHNSDFDQIWSTSSINFVSQIITEWSGVSGACKGSFLPGIETAQKV